ncbi:bifunctional lysine-specific demethylase and histidyl-hydroxylase NO66 [Nomia melanderi]|uniref:bifunctional lysine-specific demethylase and histidyl-hydroxylase NO66 n=1 Tax=Nomia melanderi TaxID=2448451 RepID=UPI003FCE46EF
MMLKHREPISAFAVQAMKRKSLELLPKSKKLKKKHNLSRKKVIVEKKIAGETLQKLIKIPVNKNEHEIDTVSINEGKVINENNMTKIIGPSSTRKKNKSNNNPIYKTKALKRDIAKIKHINKKHPKQLKNRKTTERINQFPTHNEVKTIEEHQDKPTNVSRSMYEWLIHPMKVEDFFAKNWEQTPVHIKRNCSNYYKLLMSTPLLDKILRESHILFNKNLDITSYENGVRETHNPIGRAIPSVVWDYYMNGCSVRMLNPQTYIPKLHSLNATLQEFFGCFVGANSYLTPPNSQGFAPHYDDIEAFILQVEGKKRWRLYKPRNENEYLARYSSQNFTQSEIGEPILDTVVNAGDLLYFPRGTIHQGETMDSHSLHITLSVYQKNSWGDFLEKLLPDALNTAMETDSEFRKGLPLDYLRYSGFVHSENQSNNKGEFKEKVKHLLKKLIDYIDIDKAADLMAKKNVHDFLPPVLLENEQECSIVQDGEQMTANGIVINRVEIEPDTRIRLLRSHCIRLIEENDTFRIYYSSENSKEYHEYEPQYLEVSEHFVPAVKELILRYPAFISVEELPIVGEDNKIQIVKDLWEKCLVVTDNPLPILD